MGREEFGRLPPAELWELHEAWVRRERRADYRAAALACLYANAHRDEKEKPSPFEPGDFFAMLRDDDDESEIEPTDADLAALIANLGAVDR